MMTEFLNAAWDHATKGCIAAVCTIIITVAYVLSEMYISRTLSRSGRLVVLPFFVFGNSDFEVVFTGRISLFCRNQVWSHS